MTVTIKFNNHGTHSPKSRVYKDVKDINKAYVNDTMYFCLVFKNRQICIPSKDVCLIQKVRG